MNDQSKVLVHVKGARREPMLLRMPPLLIALGYMALSVPTITSCVTSGDYPYEFSRLPCTPVEAIRAASLQCGALIAIVLLWLAFKHTRLGLSVARPGAYTTMLIIVMQVIYLILVVTLDTGIAGVPSNYPYVDALFLTYIPIDFMAQALLAMSPWRKREIALLAIVNVSYLWRGWMGGILFTAILVLVQASYLNKFRTLFRMRFILGAVSVVILLVPVLEASKWARRAGGNVGDIVESIEGRGSVAEVYEQALTYVVERLSPISPTITVLANVEAYQASYLRGETTGAWRELWLVDRATSVLSGPTGGQALTKTVIEQELGILNPEWNAGVSLSGWLALPDWHLSMPVLVGLTLTSFLLAKVLGGQSLLCYACALSIVLVWNGWIGPYEAFTRGLVIIIILGLLEQFLFARGKRNGARISVSPERARGH